MASARPRLVVTGPVFPRPGAGAAPASGTAPGSLDTDPTITLRAGTTRLVTVARPGKC